MCQFLRPGKIWRNGKSDYLPMNAWESEDQEPPGCKLTGEACSPEEYPESCPVQKRTRLLCPGCDDVIGAFLLKNGADFCHCPNGHVFRQKELSNAIRIQNV